LLPHLGGRDPGGFIVCTKKKFLFVAIAKNASSSLQKIVYQCEIGGEPPRMIHEYFGHHIDGKRRINFEQAQAPPYNHFLKFAVYRDPISRFLSCYANKVMRVEPQDAFYRYYGLNEISLDQFISFAEWHLKVRSIEEQDEHLRAQSDFYSSNQVDHIVDIQFLNSFLEKELSINQQRKDNSSEQNLPRITNQQSLRIKELYERDFLIRPSWIH
jgi:hypothetical protein